VNVINWFANVSPFIFPKHIRNLFGNTVIYITDSPAPPWQKQASQFLLCASIRSASMPLTPYLKEAVFDPKAIEAMTAAFEAVCDSLKLLDRDDPINRNCSSKGH
jgi:hypothetical protein